MGAINLKTGFFTELSTEEEKTAILKSLSYTDKETADLKCVSLHTIKAQKQAIFSKLGVRSTTEMALLLYKRVTGITIELKDFIVDNNNNLISIILLCIYLSAHWNCDLRRTTRVRIREDKYKSELIIEDI